MLSGSTALVKRSAWCTTLLSLPLDNNQFHFARQLGKNPASGLCWQTRDVGADNLESRGA